MKIEAVLQNARRLFLDTAPVIYYVEQNPRYFPVVEFLFEQLDAGMVTAITSPVTLAECLVFPYRNANAGLREDFFELITRGPNTIFHSIDHLVARRSAELRARYNLSLTDALQAAVAIQSACDVFLTNDIKLKRITEIQVLVLDELER